MNQRFIIEEKGDIYMLNMIGLPVVFILGFGYQAQGLFESSISSIPFNWN